MRPSGLIDTGAIIALVDRDDRWHGACADSTRRLPLLTSAAILTEVFHLLGDGRREREAAWRFLRTGAVQVGAIADGDLPALSEILTIDHDDFETYRIGGRQRFRIAPARRVGRR